ncbi:hypothetical protein C8R44DRAFT_725711 [Mycena epipterygia]|nr:hypothetical protein C8R44DRAFT_725711 [Mycena epipterygia]
MKRTEKKEGIKHALSTRGVRVRLGLKRGVEEAWAGYHISGNAIEEERSEQFRNEQCKEEEKKIEKEACRHMGYLYALRVPTQKEEEKRTVRRNEPRQRKVKRKKKKTERTTHCTSFKNRNKMEIAGLSSRNENPLSRMGDYGGLDHRGVGGEKGEYDYPLS